MIEFGRVKLRAIEELDQIHYYRWINDNETNYWRGLYHPSSMIESASFLKRLSQRNSTQISLTILAENERPIGIIGFRGICTRSQRAEIWVYIGERSYWNQRYGQEALKAFLDYGFFEMNLHRIWLECDSNFDLGIKCYEKVGFEREGILRDGFFRHGKFHDTMIMGIIRKKV